MSPGAIRQAIIAGLIGLFIFALVIIPYGIMSKLTEFAAGYSKLIRFVIRSAVFTFFVGFEIFLIERFGFYPMIKDVLFPCLISR